MATKPNKPPVKKAPSVVSPAKHPAPAVNSRGENIHQVQVRLKREAEAAKKQKAAQDKTYLQGRYRDIGHIPTELAKTSQSRFGVDTSGLDSRAYAELGEKVARGQMTKEQAFEIIKRGRGVRDPDQVRAGLDTAAQIDGPLAELKRKADAVKLSARQQNADDEANTTAKNRRIDEIYNSLLAQWKAERPAQDQRYADVQSSLTKRTENAQNTIRGDYSAATGNLAADAARMGLSGAEVANQGSNSDMAFLTGLVGANNNAAYNTLENLKQTFGSVADMRSQGVGAENAGIQVQQLADLARRQTLANRGAEAEALEYQGQAGDLEAGRYGSIYEGVQNIRQTRDQLAAKAAQDSRDFDLAERTLGVKEFDSQTKRFDAEANARARVQSNNIEIQKLQLERDKLNDPAAKALKEAQINKLRADSTKALADAAGGGAGGKFPDRYSQGMAVIQGIPNIQPEQANLLQSLVDSAAARTNYMKEFITNGNTYLMDELNKRGIQSAETRRYVRQALAIILGAV